MDAMRARAPQATTDVDGAFVLDSLMERPSSVQVECPSYRQLTLGAKTQYEGSNANNGNDQLWLKKLLKNIILGILQILFCLKK